MNFPKIFPAVFFAAACISMAACGSRNAEEQGAAGTGTVPAVAHFPTQGDCETRLLGWLGEGLVHASAENTRATDSGCDMSFDVGGGSPDEVKAAMTESLAAQGYVLSTSTPARRGERLIFNHADGTAISLLLRSSEVVKVTMPEATTRVYVHWYRPGNAKG